MAGNDAYLLESGLYLLPSKNAATWDESKRNRDTGGQFATKEGRSGKKDDKAKKESKSTKKKDYSNMTEAQAIKESKNQPKRDIDHVAKKFSKLIESKLKKYGAVDYVIGGSYAKGTFVDDGHGDIDVFVRFPTSLSDEEFKKKTLEMGDDVLKDYPRFRKFGQHPYTESFMNQTRLNLVGSFAIKKGDPIRSAADRSPFHVEYIKNNLTPKQKKEVISLKKLFKELGIYGASQKKHGFSGYASELLIDHYNDVESVLNYFANTDKQFKLIDPIDKNRRLDSAIEQNTLDKLTLHARGISLPNKISTPSTNIDLRVIKNNNEDAQSGQRQKALKKIIGQLERNGFNVLNSSEKNGKVKVNLESDNISKYQKQVGPPLSNKRGSDAFIKAHENETVYTKNGRLIAIVFRAFTNSNEMINSIMKEYGK